MTHHPVSFSAPSKIASSKEDNHLFMPNSTDGFEAAFDSNRVRLCHSSIKYYYTLHGNRDKSTKHSKSSKDSQKQKGRKHGRKSRKYQCKLLKDSEKSEITEPCQYKSKKDSKKSKIAEPPGNKTESCSVSATHTQEYIGPSELVLLNSIQ